ncbi:MAG: helix-turn-helix domain-containing protein [Clostridia bacterium]|nr:helix-turn-helix domain-containing protein [Clostridia bacterium]
MEEKQNIGYYSIIPSTILYNKNLKANQKILYAVITSLSNKERYCFASNKYLAEKLNARANTVSGWITDLRRKNFIQVELIRNDKQEIIQRRIYINDIPYNFYKEYPYTINKEECILQKSKENNIMNNNIKTHTLSKIQYQDRVFLYDYEYENLIEKYGQVKTDKCVEELSLYKKSKDVDYSSDYDTIKRWVIDRVEEREKHKGKENKVRKANFEQRNYENMSEEFWNSFYEN